MTIPAEATSPLAANFSFSASESLRENNLSSPTVTAAAVAALLPRPLPGGTPFSTVRSIPGKLNSLRILIATIPPVCSSGVLEMPDFNPKFFIDISELSFLDIFTVSYKLSKDIAKQSKPEPRFALEAGPKAVIIFVFFNIC